MKVIIIKESKFDRWGNYMRANAQYDPNRLEPIVFFHVRTEPKMDVVERTFYDILSAKKYQKELVASIESGQTFINTIEIINETEVEPHEQSIDSLS